MNWGLLGFGWVYIRLVKGYWCRVSLGRYSEILAAGTLAQIMCVYIYIEI